MKDKYTQEQAATAQRRKIIGQSADQQNLKEGWILIQLLFPHTFRLLQRKMTTTYAKKAHSQKLIYNNITAVCNKNICVAWGREKKKYNVRTG